MPNQDPLAPPGEQGPFSRYLNSPLEGQLQSDTKPEKRTSGFIGTTGKLAMFGSKLLEGLQRGKMQNYARGEQEKSQAFEAASNRVKALQEDPDVPSEVKAHAANLLAQSWSVMTKEQIGEIKKSQGKQGGAGSHVLGFFEHIADTLGGPTPAEHSFGGSTGATKDTAGAFNKLNELLADVHTGGEKYSTKAQAAKTQSEISESLKPYLKDYDYRGAEADPKIMSLRAKLHGISPEMAKLTDESMRTSLAPPSREETREKQYRRIQEQSGPANGSTTEPNGVPADPDFNPVRLPNGLVVKTPADMQAVLEHDGGRTTQVLMRKAEPGPNGTTVNVRREGTAYEHMPGLVTDKATGKPFEQGWTAVPQGDHDPSAPKSPALKEVRHYDAALGKDVIEFIEPTPGMKIESDLKPTAKERNGGSGRGSGGPKPPKPPTRSEIDRYKKDADKTYDEEHKQWDLAKAYGDASIAAVGSTITNPLSKSGGKVKVTKELQNQWANASRSAQGKAKRLKDSVKDKLDELHSAQDERAGVTPARSAPRDSSPARPSPTTPARQSKGKLTDRAKVSEYLDKAHGDPVEAQRLAKSDGWEF